VDTEDYAKVSLLWAVVKPFCLLHSMPITTVMSFAKDKVYSHKEAKQKEVGAPWLESTSPG
jgi:hypothetical protein